ncbi:PASTA domain-containing protein [Nonomuraea sp. NPDC050394]|uniref:PASTA domain-containing protein n=1 Tax=Nonomuraea sp. NPDC050394 TaxID=3364363 RepID=UPI00379AE847
MPRSWWTTLFGIVAIMLTFGLAGPAGALPPDKDPDNPGPDPIPCIDSIVLNSFSVSPTTVAAGQSVTVSWNVSVTTDNPLCTLSNYKVTLDGSPVGKVGSKTVQVFATRAFFLRGAYGTATKFNVFREVTVPPQQVTVPNVVGLDTAAARQAITSRGLTLTASIKIDPFCNATPGTVLSQTPVGGTQVSPGSLVRISIADWPDTCP